MDRIAKVLVLGGILGALALLTFNSQRQAPATPEASDYAEQISALELKLNEGSPVQERVIELPEDGGAWQSVIAYATPDKSSAVDRALAANFAATPRLLSLLAQTKTYETHQGGQFGWWTQRYLAGKQLPAFVLQKPDGTVCYRAGADALPTDGEALADQIAAQIADCRPRPKPTPTPQPTPQPAPDIVPNIQPAPSTPTDEMGLLSYAMIAAAGLGGAYLAVKRES